MRFIERLAEIAKHSLTGVDNRTYDIGRLLWFVGTISYIVYTGIHMYHNGTFNPIDYGTGLGIALAGGGIGVAVKKEAEPQ